MYKKNAYKKETFINTSNCIIEKQKINIRINEYKCFYNDWNKRCEYWKLDGKKSSLITTIVFKVI